MKKEVLISIDTIQTDIEGDYDTITLVTEGTFVERGEKQYITYQESELTGFAGYSTTLKVEKDQLTMVRFGPSNTQFVFAPNKSTSGIYHTPYGNFEVHVMTKELQISLQDGQGKIDIDYMLSFGGNPTSKYQFHMKITEKKRGGYRHG